MVLKASPAIKIPLNRPAAVGSEIGYIRDAIRRGQISGDGYYTRRCSAFLEKRLGAAKVLLTPSCTHALELAFLLAPGREGQEVVCPTFTFPSTANAFVLRGLKPRFIDIRPDTLNLDEQKLESHISSSTFGVVPVHYAGVPCEMDTIMAIAKKYRLVVIEDAAQALGARFKDRPVGTFGALNAFSFHETKNCMCGEGGALVLPDDRYIKRAEIVRQKGTNREQFFRGEVDKYSWVDIGSSYVPSELQAAYLLAQLERLNTITEKRRKLYERYQEFLTPLQKAGKLRLPTIPSDCTSSYHLFYVVLENRKEGLRLMHGLRQRGILAPFHYFPLHLSKMGRRYGYRKGDFPVSEMLSERLLRLPFYNTMTVAEHMTVIQAIRKLF